MATPTRRRLPPLTQSQRRLIDRLRNETSLTTRQAALIARDFRDHKSVPRSADDAVVQYVTEWQATGVSNAALPEWVKSQALPQRLSQLLSLGYTEAQARLIVEVDGKIEALAALHETGTLPELATWMALVAGSRPARLTRLLRAIPHDFLMLCLRTGCSNAGEIASWNGRRVTGDTLLHDELGLLAALRS